MEPDVLDRPPPMPADPLVPGQEVAAADAIESRPGAGGGVPLWLVGAGICAAGALGIVIGVRVGRMFAAHQLGEPTRVQPVFVEQCADCAKRKAEARMSGRDGGGVEPPPAAPIDQAAVDAYLAKQAEVEAATA